MSPLKAADDDGPNHERNSGFTDREVSQFLLRFCHDLRGPLRAMQAHADLLLKDALAPSSTDLPGRLAFIAGGARQSDALVDGLTSYAIALQMDAESFRPVPADLILRNALARVANEVRETDAQVSYGQLPRLNGNMERLMQVFENLLRNAVRHRGAGSPRIEISAEPDGRQLDAGASWRFAVRDNGPGVAVADLKNIFKPFEKIGANRTGAGLGLAICRIIVEKHGGAIWAESNSGTGSTFLMTLPAAENC